jgi:hypothetical protein
MKEIKKGFGIYDTKAFNAYHVLHGGGAIDLHLDVVPYLVAKPHSGLAHLHIAPKKSKIIIFLPRLPSLKILR